MLEHMPSAILVWVSLVVSIYLCSVLCCRNTVTSYYDGMKDVMFNSHEEAKCEDTKHYRKAIIRAYNSAKFFYHLL